MNVGTIVLLLLVGVFLAGELLVLDKPAARELPKVLLR